MKTIGVKETSRRFGINVRLVSDAVKYLKLTRRDQGTTEINRGALVAILTIRRLMELQAMDPASRKLYPYLKHMITSTDPDLERAYLVVAGKPIQECVFTAGDDDIVLAHPRGPSAGPIQWKGQQDIFQWGGRHNRIANVSLGPLFRRVDKELAKDEAEPEAGPAPSESTG